MKYRIKLTEIATDKVFWLKYIRSEGPRGEFFPTPNVDDAYSFADKAAILKGLTAWGESSAKHAPQTWRAYMPEIERTTWKTITELGTPS